jgi:hypothetical protein
VENERVEGHNGEKKTTKRRDTGSPQMMLGRFRDPSTWRIGLNAPSNKYCTDGKVVIV